MVSYVALTGAQVINQLHFIMNLLQTIEIKIFHFVSEMQI